MRQKIYPKLLIHASLNQALAEAGLPTFNIVEYKAVKFKKGYVYNHHAHMNFFSAIEQNMPHDNKLSHFEDWCDEVGRLNIKNSFTLPVGTLEGQLGIDLTYSKTGDIESMPIAMDMCPAGCTTDGFDLIYSEWSYGHTLIFTVTDIETLLDNGTWAMNGIVSRIRRFLKYRTTGNFREFVAKNDGFLGHLFICRSETRDNFVLVPQGPTAVCIDPRYGDYDDSDELYLPELVDFLAENYNWKLDNEGN